MEQRLPRVCGAMPKEWCDALWGGGVPAHPAPVVYALGAGLEPFLEVTVV